MIVDAVGEGEITVNGISKTLLSMQTNSVVQLQTKFYCTP